MSSVKRARLINLSSVKFTRERPAFNLRSSERSFSDKVFPFISQQNLSPLKYINDKLQQIIKFFEEFSGLKELKLAHEKVEEAGMRLSIIQEERRNNFNTLLEIQSKLKGIYSQLETVKRGDMRYIALITEEHDLLKQEEVQQAKFKQIDRAERDQFTFFSYALRNSHEKERTQTQKTKYWSIIGSVVGTMIGFFASTMSSYKKDLKLKKLIAESSNSNLELKLNKFLENYNKLSPELNTVHDAVVVRDKILKDVMNMNTASDNSTAHKYLNDLLKKTNELLLNLEESTKLVQNMSGFEIYKLRYDSDNKTDLLLLNLERLCYENQEVKRYLGYVIIILFISTIVRLAN